MATNSTQELRDFHRFVGEQVHHGGVMLSPEEILDEWRRRHPVPDEAAEDLADIQDAVADMEQGDQGIPFAEFDREFRARRHLPATS